MRKIMLRGLLSLTAASLPIVAGGVASAAGWGDVEGQFILEGDVPESEVVIAKDANVKDKEVCAADTLYSSELVVEKESKGIANIFVYLRKAPAAIHPELKNPPAEPVVFDQKGCEFIPHALVVRTGQDVLVKSDDPVPHNTHTHPLRNNEDNFIVRPNDRDGIPLAYKMAEPLPTKVDCDIHPHMKAYWLIVDHPYAAVTDEQGKFTIKDLPAGEHTISLWHERVGYLDRALGRTFKVTVKDGETTTIEPVTVPLAKLK